LLADLQGLLIAAAVTAVVAIPIRRLALSYGILDRPGSHKSHSEPIPNSELEAELRLDLSQPFVLFTQHPVTGDVDAAARQMEISLRVLDEVGVQVVATYPNSDAGGRAMIEVLKGWEGRPWLRIVPSLGQRRFASLLKQAAAVVGNSSSGIIETPFFGVPVVNIGPRQAGRLRAANVLDVAHDQEAIRSAIVCALSDETFKARARSTNNPYGDGHAGERIVEILTALEIGPELLDKRITY